MFHQYLCYECFEHSYVFWLVPSNPYCWSCGSEKTKCTGEVIELKDVKRNDEM
jgi:hypothetical protein